MGNGHVSRYIGGKRPQKYFEEDLWPQSENYLRKLSFDEGRAFEIFKLFCKIDIDESGTLEVDECMNYIGGKRTRFTERIFDVFEPKEESGGLSFTEFTYIVWNFLTLSTAGVARYVFEIFDPDNNGVVEQPDVEAMYRMLYDAENHDTKHITMIKFDENGKITKEKFIKHMKSKKFVIKPALEYQTRMKRQLGGVIMWEGLAGYRKRHFSVFDSKSTTLEESFKAILAAPDPNEPVIPPDAEALIRQEKAKITDAIMDAKQRMVEFKRYQEDEKRKKEANIEDRAVSLAWMAFEAKKYQFQSMQFTLEDIFLRQEERNALYEVFDRAVEVQNGFWVEKGRKEEIQAFGTEEDKVARVKDFLATEEGKLERERIRWLILLETAYKRLEIQTGSNEKGKANLAAIQSQLGKLEEGSHNFFPVKKLSEKFTKKYDFDGLEAKTDERFRDLVLERGVQEMRNRRVEDEDKREKDIRRKEFELMTKFGSRNTRWETVIDTENDRTITINIDTMKILAPKVCICELCDAIIEENDFRCFACNALRSAKNTPFYRPLGAL